MSIEASTVGPASQQTVELRRRIARRPVRRIAALNHSHLSALSGGLLLLCGGDWEPLLGLPSSAGCVARRDQCCLVALPLLDWQLPWLGRSWCLSVVHGQVSVLFMTSLGTSCYHGAQQPPSPQSPSTASLCLPLATSGAALTP